MIRRRPPTPAQRRRRAVGVVAAAVVVVLGVAVRGPDTSGARRAGPPERAHAFSHPALGPPAPPAPRVAVTRVFHASGGPVTAVVMVKGTLACEVDLLGPAGAVLAQGWARQQPLTLRAVAGTNAPLSLVLHPTGGMTLSWEADLSGASG